MNREDVKMILAACLLVAACTGVFLALSGHASRDSEWQEMGYRLTRHEVPGGWIYHHDSSLVFVPTPRGQE